MFKLHTMIAYVDLKTIWSQFWGHYFKGQGHYYVNITVNNDNYEYNAPLTLNALALHF